MIAKDIKPGIVVNYNEQPVLVQSLSVQSPSARGAATLYKFRGRNLVSKQKVDFTLKGGDSLNEADFARRPVKYMYADGTQSHFLDQTDFNQYSLETEQIEDELKYITEDLEGMTAMIYNDECVGVQLPTAVVLKITFCEPTARGNSATGRTKPATLQTGLIIQVPEYMTEGEMVKVDTRTGDFLGRAT